MLVVVVVVLVVLFSGSIGGPPTLRSASSRTYVVYLTGSGWSGSIEPSTDVCLLVPVRSTRLRPGLIVSSGRLEPSLTMGPDG